MGVHLADLTSDVLEPLANILGIEHEFNSTGDMLFKLDSHNNRVEELMIFYENKLGYKPGCVRDLLILIAADCEAMFPSMRRISTSKIIAKMFMESSMKVGGFSWKEAAKYITIVCQPNEIHQAGLSQLMPVRRHNKGPRPGLASKDVHSKTRDADDQ